MATAPDMFPTPRPNDMAASVAAQLDRVDESTREAHISTQATIARFERTHRLSSVDMQRRVASGELEETDEICQWLIELDLLAGILANLR